MPTNYPIQKAAKQADGTWRFEAQTLRLDKLAGDGEELVYDIQGFDSLIVQLTDNPGITRTGNTISVRYSLDGITPQAIGGGITFVAASGISSLIEEAAFGFLHVGVTTVGSGAGTTNVYVVGVRRV